ncbi:MAG: hypothetical protein ACYCQJ_05605 [Nitrososphaerales archaeon]
MERLLSEEFVKNRVIEWLGRKGYRVISVKGLAEHGLDIKAKRLQTNYYYAIEAKGDPLVNPSKMRYPFLVSALGEIIQRVTKAKYCRYAIALPISYEELVKRRVPSMAAKRLDLEFLFIKINGSVERMTWKQLAQNS